MYVIADRNSRSMSDLVISLGGSSGAAVTAASSSTFSSSSSSSFSASSSSSSKVVKQSASSSKVVSSSSSSKSSNVSIKSSGESYSDRMAGIIMYQTDSVRNLCNDIILSS